MSASIQVRPLDAWDDAEMDAAYDVWRRGEVYERPHAVDVGRDELRAWVARRDGVVAGLATAIWPLIGDVTHCWPTLVVAPEHRRKGAGTALWRVLARATRMAGRHVVQADIGRPVGVERWPGVEFARHHGFAQALHEEHHVLRLAAAGRLPSAEPADGYGLRTWQAHCPDDLVAAYCRLRERFVAEVPTGDLVIGEQVWDTTRLRVRAAPGGSAPVDVDDRGGGPR